MDRVFLIVNPAAAAGKVKARWFNEVVPLLEKAGLKYQHAITEHPGHAIEMAGDKVREGFRVICAVGGDGTSNEVINGVLKSGQKGVFGAIPLGSGDDIPTAFGIPEKSVEAAVQCLCEGQDMQFDVGYCETADRYFAGVASMGFDAEVTDCANKAGEKAKGAKSYNVAVIKTLLKFKPYELEITVDDNRSSVGDRMLVAIGNGKRYGGGMHICPAAEILDGKFSVTALNKLGRFALLRIFPRVYGGSHLSHPSFETFEGASIHVRSSTRSCLYQIDGEVIGPLPETFTTKPGHLTVRVPKVWRSYSQIWLEKKGK